MKNLIVNIFKTLFFFDFLIIVISLIPDIKTENAALLTLWNEGSAFLAVGIFTLFFLKKVEKKKLKFSEKKGKIKPAFLGMLIGAGLPLIYTALMWVLKQLNFAGFNKIPQVWFYIGAIFFNALWGELLIRGYLFSLYKKHYGFIFATVVTTLLFISMSLEIFKVGKIYAAVIILLNIMLCFIREHFKTPVVTVFARFSYQLLSGFILGGKLLSEDYGVWGKLTFSGKKLITGGENIVEGSVITLIVLSVTVFVILTVKYKLWRYLTKENLRICVLKIKDFFGDIGYGIKRIIRR